MRGAATALATMLVLGGCTVGPDFERPAAWWSPQSWFQGRPPSLAPQAEASAATTEPIDPRWWTLFHDPMLTDLETRVAGANLDVRVAGIRLAQSRASLGVAHADQLAQFNGNASFTREQQSAKGVIGLLGGGGSGASSGTTGATSGSGAGGLANTPASGTPGAASNGTGGRSGGLQNTSLVNPFNLFQYGFDATWEVDLWGRVRRNVENAEANVTASEEQRRNTLVTSLAELARDYIQLRGTQRQMAILRQNLDIAQQSLGLTQQRAAGGLTTDLDVANAAAQVATTQSQMPALESQEAQLANAIALLLGEAPQAMRVELATPKPVPPVPPTVPVGLPSELARRRADVRAAEAQLHAATADVGVAVADFYPRVTLSGSLAIQAVNAKDLASWAAHTYSFGPAISIPIFEGGRLTRTLELRQAQQQEAAFNYQRTVLGALHDVDNALTAYDSEQRRRAQLARAVDANRRAVGLARDRYTQGLADFLSVLDAQRSLLAAETQLTDSTTTISTNLVQLYKALGGGWEGDYPDLEATRVIAAR